jgi:type I restriction enzyme, S subunit
MSHYKPYPAYKDSGVEWLGRVPEHWQIKRLKHIANVQTGVAKGKDNEGKDTIEVPYLRVANVQDGYFSLDDVATIEIPREDLTRYSLQPGDVLMNEGGDFDKVGRGSVWQGEIEPCIHQNHVFAVRPTAVSSAWLNAFTGSLAAQFYFMGRAKQSTNLASISSSNIMELPVAMPPATEVDLLLAHLDRETVRIDALIEKKTRFIELLREKRQALIIHAVTKGLDPSVKMKNSGVEWLGEVPDHWETMNLARVTVARCDGPFGSAIKSENYTDSGVRVIRLQNIGIGEFKDGDQAFLSPEYRSQVIGNSHDVELGDLLIAGLGDENNPLGRTCVAPASLGDAIVKADCYRFRLDRSKALPSFLALQLSATARVECGFISTGSTRERLNLGLAASRVIALPPSIEEQSAIVEQTAMATVRLDALLSKTGRSIDLLKERRTSLITAAVTGQIDLRETV